MSQNVIETEYYMIDLPKVLEAKRRQKARTAMEDAMLEMLPHLKNEDRKRFITEMELQSGLKKEIETQNVKFSREKMDSLHVLYGQLRGKRGEGK
ncbi:hypothetical protein [Mechercharimyces sp. CAU 1602]|uniref:hypothetical protein n=1 Tax=Mechercharimyces sp. CAU 1602 TaxID=2973933 RepID=UPI002162F5F3|nr:hypothetical protein [Mechercharimyces sp. CAU 1602]MCS1350324.1 hypothetical protein [Mechercharimyces sp. CAU 1602]